MESVYIVSVQKWGKLQIYVLRFMLNFCLTGLTEDFFPYPGEHVHGIFKMSFLGCMLLLQ